MLCSCYKGESFTSNGVPREWHHKLQRMSLSAWIDRVAPANVTAGRVSPSPTVALPT